MLSVILVSSVPAQGKGHGDRDQARREDCNEVGEEISDCIRALGVMAYRVLWPRLQLQRE